MPYSGPASAYGQIGKTEEACFNMINEKGGINGHKIDFISYDDAYSPPKTVEQTRKLVESDDVLFSFQNLGTPTNTAVHKYYNQKEVPQLFVATGASKWGDPENFPWTMGWQPHYQTEAKIYAKYILDNMPDAKIAVLYQNDDYGKDYLKGFKDGLGDKAGSMIVAELPYETSDPTVDSQIVSAKQSGADTFFNVTTPKFAAQAIKKAHEIDWHPTHFLNNVSISVGAVMKPAGSGRLAGDHQRGLPDGPDRPAVEGQRRIQGLGRRSWTSTIRTATRRRASPLRLCRVHDAEKGAGSRRATT